MYPRKIIVRKYAELGEAAGKLKLCLSQASGKKIAMFRVNESFSDKF